MSAAVIALTEALDAAKVPNKSVVFTERDPSVQHWIIKDWTERVNSDTMAEKFSAVDMHQNADGDNVMYAYRELLARNSRRKILIVLSDGMPCCDRWGDADGYLQAVTSMIQGQGKVELYGIGILSDAVKRYYRDYTVLKDAKSIESCVVDVVKQKIIGR
jgi:cobalamin biosynthesis protein CobT